MTDVRLRELELGRCRHGVMCWPKRDGTIGRALGLYGEFAEGENRVMARYLKAGGVAVDVGANLGTTALAMARAVGELGQVIAFEPQPLMAQCLMTSLTLNEMYQVRLLSTALGSVRGWSTMAALGVQEGGNYGAIGLGEGELAVPVLTLDELALPRLDVLKVDVEGYEWSVVQGAQGQVLRHRPVLYLEAKRLPGTALYLRWLRSQGWRCYWHFAFFYRADNFRGQAENVFGGTGDMNVLAVPEEAGQPDDLPEIAHPEEDWRPVYGAFFEARKLAMP